MIEADASDVAEFGVKNMQAVLGSLSHGHLNCLDRNIEAGVRGCECIELTVVGKTKVFNVLVRPSLSWTKMETTPWPC